MFCFPILETPSKCVLNELPLFNPKELSIGGVLGERQGVCVFLTDNFDLSEFDSKRTGYYSLFHSSIVSHLSVQVNHKKVS